MLTPFGEGKVKGKKGKKSQDLSEDCARLCAAIKLLSYDRSSPLRKISDEVDMDEDSEEESVEGTVIDLLFRILDGDVPGGRGRVSPSEMTQLRRVTACAALRLGAKHELTPEQWHSLGWTMQVYPPFKQLLLKCPVLSYNGSVCFRIPRNAFDTSSCAQWLTK